MPEPLEVASIVLNYGRADLARAAIESLLASDHPSHRVLLADNASPDADLAARHAAALGVPFLRFEENLGFARGMNEAIRGAERAWPPGPEFLFLLNGDARVERNALSLLTVAARSSGAALAAPKILLDDGASPPRLWAAGGTFSRFRARNRGEGEVDRGQYDRGEELDFLSGCALLIRRDAFRELGAFDPRFFLYQEDVDLSFRARARGLRLWYEPRARAHHLGSASAGSEFSAFQSFYRWRNRLLLLGKHLRCASRIFFFGLFFPAVALRDLVRYGRQGRWREIGPLFAGLWDWFRGCRNPRRPDSPRSDG